MILLSMILLSLSVVAGAAEFGRGRDLLPVFARAHAGQPLRAAAIGGSITQAGGGWLEPWLREQFPKAAVTMRNAGMSATGSALGVFRLERDVISAQPDLVLIEYAVNDGGTSDEDAIRYTESIVVRLKSLPHPPAIVFVEAAAKGGSKRHRHQRVAKHYGLLDKGRYGSFYVNLDGDEPRLVDTGFRGGYTYTILGRDLQPREHGRAGGGRGRTAIAAANHDEVPG
jgi:hypothetical protein